VLVMAATAVVHLYSASLYYLTEIISGLTNVNTQSFVGLWIKFFFANLPWLVVPWCVFAWAGWMYEIKLNGLEGMVKKV
jgi:hypothetical protein